MPNSPDINVSAQDFNEGRRGFLRAALIVAAAIALPGCASRVIDQMANSPMLPPEATSMPSTPETVSMVSSETMVRNIENSFISAPTQLTFAETIINRNVTAKESQKFLMDGVENKLMVLTSDSDDDIAIVRHSVSVLDLEGKPKLLSDGTLYTPDEDLLYAVRVNKKTGTVGEITPMFLLDPPEGSDEKSFLLAKIPPPWQKDTPIKYSTLSFSNEGIVLSDAEGLKENFGTLVMSEVSPTPVPQQDWRVWLANFIDISPRPVSARALEATAIPVEWIEDEVETGVNLLDQTEGHKWVLEELKRVGKTEDEILNIDTSNAGAMVGFTGFENSIVTTEGFNWGTIIGHRTIELPDSPGGKLRCLIMTGTGRDFRITMTFALDAQDKDGNWTLLLPGVNAKSPSEVTNWVNNNKFRLLKNSKMINLLTDPKYLEDPMWLKGIPGDETLRNTIINKSYIGWGTRDPYALAINGEKRRANKDSIEEMMPGALGLGYADLMQYLDLLNKHQNRTEVCLFGSNISVQ